MTASTVLRASALTDTHPELPDGWTRTIGKLRQYGWPNRFGCASCGLPSYLSYRCSRCGRDIAGVVE